MGAHAGLACDICHVVEAGGRPVAPVTLSAREETLCAGCHAKAWTKRTEPTTRAVSCRRALPAEFPLDAEGRLTCSTCHDLHGGAAVLLRAGTWACTACHLR